MKFLRIFLIRTLLYSLTLEHIPLFFIEEHHEAFYIWHYAISHSLISSSNNILLHVDTHSDLSSPVLTTPINDLSNHLPDIHKFTYDELGIGSFIYPAIYQGIFNQVFWMGYFDNSELSKNLHSTSLLPMKNQILSTYNNEGKIFLINQTTLNNSRSVSFSRQDFTISESLSIKQPVVLDIDLDYFSCATMPNHPIPIEVTKDQFHSFCQNPYHLLRFEYTCVPVQKESRFYFIFNQSEDLVYRPEAHVSKQTILARIEVFGTWLRENKINPQIIEICRDQYSGYAPFDQIEFIENALVEKLNKIFEMDIKTV